LAGLTPRSAKVKSDALRLARPSHRIRAIKQDDSNLLTGLPPTFTAG